MLKTPVSNQASHKALGQMLAFVEKNGGRILTFNWPEFEASALFNSNETAVVYVSLYTYSEATGEWSWQFSQVGTLPAGAGIL